MSIPDFDIDIKLHKEYINLLENNPIYLLLQNTIPYIKDGNIKLARDRLINVLDRSFE